MTIEAKIIADSISPAGKRITTFQLRYPRFIHAELMTHRVFSRNASSSRAIPVERMIEDLLRDPAMPVYWGANQKGMQAAEELSSDAIEDLKGDWLNAMHQAIGFAQKMMERGLHKQIANRILEPWAHINVVVTATDYENFYALRRHSDAQPEIKVLADCMWLAQNQSTPRLLQPGQWHLPYVSTVDFQQAYDQNFIDETDNPHTLDAMTQQNLIKVSVARCARVSYLTHDGRETTIEEDLALYDRLVGGIPLHASPAEHQATPDEKWTDSFDHAGNWKHPEEHGNFTGWRQYRKMLPGEFTPG